MTVLEITYSDYPTTVDHVTANGGQTGSPDIFRFHFDPETEPVTHAVVEAVALVHNVPQSELDPLERSIDTDALTAFVTADSDASEIAFEYEEMEVTVHSAGDIWLQWK